MVVTSPPSPNAAEVLAREEREAADRAERADRVIVIARADGLRRVLDDRQRRAAAAALRIGCSSAAWPNRCTGMMALVRGVMAAMAACRIDVERRRGSMSTSTGVAPSRDTQPAVAKNE